MFRELNVQVLRRLSSKAPSPFWAFLACRSRLCGSPQAKENQPGSRPPPSRSPLPARAGAGQGAAEDSEPTTSTLANGGRLGRA